MTLCRIRIVRRVLVYIYISNMNNFSNKSIWSRNKIRTNRTIKDQSGPWRNSNKRTSVLPRTEVSAYWTIIKSNILNIFIWPIDDTLICTIIPYQSRPGSNGCHIIKTFILRVLPLLQRSRQCILHPQPTGFYIYIYIYICKKKNAQYSVMNPSFYSHFLFSFYFIKHPWLFKHHFSWI